MRRETERQNCCHERVHLSSPRKSVVPEISSRHWLVKVRESPKSHSLTCVLGQFSTRRMFWGWKENHPPSFRSNCLLLGIYLGSYAMLTLISRWTTLFSWRNATASSTCFVTCEARSSSRQPSTSSTNCRSPCLALEKPTDHRSMLGTFELTIPEWKSLRMANRRRGRGWGSVDVSERVEKRVVRWAHVEGDVSWWF